MGGEIRICPDRFGVAFPDFLFLCNQGLRCPWGETAPLEKFFMKIGILTCRDLSRFFPSSEDPYFTHDDQVLVDFLRAKGHQVEPVFWMETLDQKLSGYDICIVRSTWDYMNSLQHQKDFRRWFAFHAQQSIPVANAPGVILWNLEKTYLQDLQEVGVAVVPTVFVTPDVPFHRSMIQEQVDLHGSIVIKPAVSAAARDTVLVHPGSDLGALQSWNGPVGENFDAWRQGRSLLMQPFIKEIETEGEWSLVYFGKSYSHSVRKIPKAGSWLVQDELGGSVVSEEPPVAVRKCGDRAVERMGDAFGLRHSPQQWQQPLYCRVDVIPAAQGPLVGEVELIEPELFFLQREPLAKKPLDAALGIFYQELLQLI